MGRVRSQQARDSAFGNHAINFSKTGTQGNAGPDAKKSLIVRIILAAEELAVVSFSSFRVQSRRVQIADKRPQSPNSGNGTSNLEKKRQEQ